MIDTLRKNSIYLKEVNISDVLIIVLGEMKCCNLDVFSVELS